MDAEKKVKNVRKKTKKYVDKQELKWYHKKVLSKSKKHINIKYLVCKLVIKTTKKKHILVYIFLYKKRCKNK